MNKKTGPIILLILFLLFGAYQLMRYIKSDVETTPAVLIRREDVISANCYVARREEVYAAENTGTMYNYVAEGARVGKNVAVATVYRGDVDAELIGELNNIDTKIDRLEKSIQNSEAFITDNSSSDNKIAGIKNKIISAAVNNNISEISGYKSALSSLGTQNDDKEEFELFDLRAERTSLESRLSSDKTDIYSTMSGVYSVNIDGFEDILTPDTITNFHIADFNALGDAEFSEKTKNTVSSGERICKVVDNHTWYIIAAVTRDEADVIKKKQNVRIRFDSLPGAEVDASFAYVSEEDEKSDKVVISLKSDRFLEGVYGIRQSQIDIITDRYVGYEVPTYAVRNIKDTNDKMMEGVYIKAGSSRIFCKCNTVYKNEASQTSIIYPASDARRTLGIGDMIILGEKTAYNEIPPIGEDEE